jgi:crotonobetainyl-CoA:carnitine CoA-transferase CaiB-like acyl-CoA transferase
MPALDLIGRTAMTPVQALESLWKTAGGDAAFLGNIRIVRPEAHLPSVFQVGTLAAATIGAQALAAAALWRLRDGAAQQTEVDVRRALAMFRSERYLTIDGKPPPNPWDPLAGYYQAGDGRWIQLHTNFLHHRDGVLRVLGCGPERKDVEAAIAGWTASELDARLAEEGMCAAMVRQPDEWEALAQAQAIARLPLFEIIRIGDAPPEPPGGGGKADRPLSGVRVLDLSRIIAAPVAARTLAQHGADVLAVGAAHLPNIDSAVMDTGRGKRSAFVDLRDDQGRATLHRLVKSSDIFLQAYRPGALAHHGFSPEELAAERPGLIYVTLSAYGHEGPWKARRGFDSLVQSATGIAWEEGQAAGLAGPGKLPCQALDHATGYLAAFGAMMALQRRAAEGGSWLVRVSLAQTGRWLQSMPRMPDGLKAPELDAAEIAPWLEESASGFGRMTAVAPVEIMRETPPRFALPAVRLGVDVPVWE